MAKNIRRAEYEFQQKYQCYRPHPTTALQEVDRQQQADKARIAELENQVSNMEATVATQQSLINDILERLKTLERTLKPGGNRLL